MKFKKCLNQSKDNTIEHWDFIHLDNEHSRCVSNIGRVLHFRRG